MTRSWFTMPREGDDPGRTPSTEVQTGLLFPRPFAVGLYASSGGRLHEASRDLRFGLVPRPWRLTSPPIPASGFAEGPWVSGREGEA